MQVSTYVVKSSLIYPHRAPILGVALLCVGSAGAAQDLHWWLLLQLNSPSGPAQETPKSGSKTRNSCLAIQALQ